MLLLDAILLTYRAYRDDVVSKLCSVIVPPIFLYTFFMCFFGVKYANWLIRKDNYKEKRIKVRRFAIIRMIGIDLAVLSLIGYFAFYKLWDMVGFLTAFFLGHAWIKLRTYSARLEYTYRYIIFRTGKKQEKFPWGDVMEMSWVGTRGSIACLLKIRFRTGLTAELSSNDFVGLTALKTFYDEGHFK